MPLKEIGRYTHESRTLPLVNCIRETFCRVLVRKTEPSEITELGIVQPTLPQLPSLHTSEFISVTLCFITFECPFLLFQVNTRIEVSHQILV
jgi:hypothetical protein